MVNKLRCFQQECVDAFMLEFSKDDIKKYPEVRKLAKKINRQGKKIDMITKHIIRLFGY